MLLQAVSDEMGVHSNEKQCLPSLVHLRQIHHSGFFEGIDDTTCKRNFFQQKIPFFLNPRVLSYALR